MVFYSCMSWERTCLDGGTSTRKRATSVTPFSHKIRLPICEAKAVRFERSSQSLGQHLKAVVCPVLAIGCSLEAKVAFGSSVPISPETTEWRTQSVQLHSQSPKEAFLQGSLEQFWIHLGKYSCSNFFWPHGFIERSEARNRCVMRWISAWVSCVPPPRFPRAEKMTGKTNQS